MHVEPRFAERVLDANGVQIWRAWLDQPQWFAERLLPTLSADECARARRCRSERDRTRFVAGRGMLRVLLSRLMNFAPERITFRYGGQGKPALADDCGGREIHFNVAHSRGLALYAISQGRRIGVDVEYADGTLACDHIAARFFSPRENKALGALPDNERRREFFRLWTCKEACLKARGDGISPDLAQLLEADGVPSRVAPWIVEDVAAAPAGYVAAVAVARDAE